jgi:hypothetical protein
MHCLRFDRCSQPDYLRRIGRAPLTRWLVPFAPELAAHGVALATAALADDAFYLALAGLARQPEGLSEPLQMMLLAIDVTNEVLPDERQRGTPLVVTELRLRVRANAGMKGLVDCWVEGLGEAMETANHQPPTANNQGEFKIQNGTFQKGVAPGQEACPLSPAFSSTGEKESAAEILRHGKPAGRRARSDAPYRVAICRGTLATQKTWD